MTVPAQPEHARAAPSHPDPYAYCARLVRGPALVRDTANEWWVAANSGAVRAVLESELCLTRPSEDRVPAALQTGAMAEIFGRLVRFDDGPGAAAMKRALVIALAGLEFAEVERVAAARIGSLAAPHDLAGLTDFAFAFPVQTIADLMGFPTADLVARMAGYGAASAAAATGIPPLTPDILARGHASSAALLAAMAEVRSAPRPAANLLDAVVSEAEAQGIKDEAEINANALGLMIQGYGAIAGMIGLGLLALARRPDLRRRVLTDRRLIGPLVDEVARFDSSTHSTLRFPARDGHVAGQAVKAGDMIVVMLAAAGRDPALNPLPDAFDIDRPDRRSMEFGAGAHACPGERLALRLTQIGIGYILDLGFDLDALEPALTYAASAHVRTPLFGR